MKVKLAWIFATLMGAGVVHADTLTVGNSVNGYGLSIRDSAVGSVTAAIDPYAGIINKGQPSQTSILLFCIDPDHWDSASTYNIVYGVNGNGSNTNLALNGISTLSKGKGFTNSSQLYGGLAWLSEQLYSAERGPQTGAAILAQQEYQAAIWALADDTNTFQVTTSPTPLLTLAQFNSAVSGFEQQAYANRLSNGFTILTQQGETANCPNCAQEYLVLAPVPEPSSVLLLGIGLGGMSLRLRRKSKARR